MAFDPEIVEFPPIALTDQPGDSTEVALRSLREIDKLVAPHYAELRAALLGDVGLREIISAEEKTEHAKADFALLQGFVELLPVQSLTFHPPQQRYYYHASDIFRPTTVEVHAPDPYTIKILQAKTMGVHIASDQIPITTEPAGSFKWLSYIVGRKDTGKKAELLLLGMQTEATILPDQASSVQVPERQMVPSPLYSRTFSTRQADQIMDSGDILLHQGFSQADLQAIADPVGKRFRWPVPQVAQLKMFNACMRDRRSHKSLMAHGAALRGGSRARHTPADFIDTPMSAYNFERYLADLATAFDKTPELEGLLLARKAKQDRTD
ncbi:MAG: hypothetical protein JWN38_230 [Candidatus Saccharibacteria bacterium]|nr:hypothetical protein [Candidatus Saccharibacteria bacterium]